MLHSDSAATVLCDENGQKENQISDVFLERKTGRRWIMPQNGLKLVCIWKQQNKQKTKTSIFK